MIIKVIVLMCRTVHWPSKQRIQISHIAFRSHY